MTSPIRYEDSCDNVYRNLSDGKVGSGFDDVRLT